MIAGIREKLGLNDPMPVQFIHWVRDMLGGDFGLNFCRATGSRALRVAA
nr:hypothetical protein [Mesorhizobium sp.]